ncbi:hypothetical protein ACJIZ3_016544 [Penstemon smallii]|uniref:Autophagy-related protein n=1 Tax=Penstemon smallii TaxID=265156 RepID=A0ABD3ST63_9LAMI
MGKAKTQPFKDQFSFEERLQESLEIIVNYPDCRYHRTKLFKIGTLDHFSTSSLSCNSENGNLKGFLVPRDMSVGQFIHMILGSRLHLSPGKALFVFAKNTLPQTSSLIESVYDSFKNEDGFLYIYVL